MFALSKGCAEQWQPPEEFRRLRPFPPPPPPPPHPLKQELHAYPFILENPCRSEALGNTLHIPMYPGPGIQQRTTAYLRSSRVPGCIYVHAFVTYFRPVSLHPPINGSRSRWNISRWKFGLWIAALPSLLRVFLLLLRSISIREISFL